MSRALKCYNGGDTPEKYQHHEESRPPTLAVDSHKSWGFRNGQIQSGVITSARGFTYVGVAREERCAPFTAAAAAPSRSRRAYKIAVRLHRRERRMRGREKIVSYAPAEVRPRSRQSTEQRLTSPPRAGTLIHTREESARTCDSEMSSGIARVAGV